MTKDEKRFRPYIWVTWLTPLLAGADVCEWKAWYKAHFRYTKLAREDGDLDSWKIAHDAMVRAIVARLTAAGWKVNVEDQNAFKLEGERATLAGKPDIVAVKGANALVVDAKSGQAKDADIWQVLVYLWVLPRLKFKIPADGQVEYKGSTTRIQNAKLDVDASAKIRTLLQTVGGDLEPPRAPSANECKFCDIASCPDRVESTTTVATTEDF
jgi:CRISPR/Cas system-associated exonuclease Cas4 (RecB family)